MIAIYVILEAVDSITYITNNAHNNRQQRGFRKGLSREGQPLGAQHHIVRCVDRGDTVYAVVMDFAKAFDKVPHQLLMDKLSRVPNINSKKYSCGYTAS